jgi:hypothetical protein
LYVVRNDEVAGSIPVTSTKFSNHCRLMVSCIPREPTSVYSQSMFEVSPSTPFSTAPLTGTGGAHILNA